MFDFSLSKQALLSKQAIKIASVFLLVLPVTTQGQGFGAFQKKIVTVNRLLPPTVNLKGKKIRVDATADAVQRDGEQLRALLKTRLVTLIQKDPRFILNETSPETILKFSITNYYVEKWTTGTGNNQKTSNRGKIEVAYQAIDVTTNAALDSENLENTAGYDPTQSHSSLLSLPFPRGDRKKEAAEASENETRDQLVSGIVSLMARRIAPLDQPFESLLPGGKLEPLSSLAQSSRWGALEEQAEKMDKLQNPADDAYRLYLLALAKEALAYDLTREANERDLGKRTDISPAQAEAQFHRAQKYLDEAGAIYKQIITANSKEKAFRPGDARTEEALAIYAKIERYKAENAKSQAPKAPPVVVPGPNGGTGTNHDVPSSTGHLSPLDQVLDFCNRGLAAESIKEYIESPDFLADAKATGYKFNFARDSVRLNDTCKQNAAAFQRAIRQRLGGGTAPAHK
ncbi:MAG TPA: hypothetical protein VNW97_14180 [Candidatus Saccharimonadales bacterium]|jgi:hypothetical protein|nr:hypothetical protein [Candidatus Saccharimonadales bacterium]